MLRIYSFENKNGMKNSSVILLYILTLLFFCHTTVCAQHNIRHLDTSDGLSNSYVTSFAEDNNGCMWVGTESGLNRFNGQRFELMASPQDGLTPSAYISRLFFDPRTQLLWVSIDPNTCCTINSLDGSIRAEAPQFKQATGFSPMGKDQLWISTRNMGVWLTRSQQQPIPLSKICPKAKIPKDCFDIFYDGKDCLYIAHIDNGLSVVHLKTGKTERYNGGWNAKNGWPCARIYKLTPDSLGQLWLSTSNGLTCMNLLTHQFINYFHAPNNNTSILSNHVYYSIFSQNQELWVGSDVGGVSIASIKKNTGKALRFRHITPQWGDIAIASRNIRSLIQDRYGNIWIGNYSRGIDVIPHIRPMFRTIENSWFDGQRMQPKSTWGLFQNTDGTLWAGGENEIYRIPTTTDTLFVTNSISLKPWLKRTIASVTTLTNDKQNHLLIGLFDDGLLQFDPKNNTCKRVDIGADHIDVASFMHQKDGSILIAAENGAWIYDGTTTLKPYKEINQILPGSSISSFTVDSMGRMLVSTFGSGLCIFDQHKRCIFRWRTNQYHLQHYIYTIMIDSHGEVWFATHNGLGHTADLKNLNQIEIFTHDNGLPDNHIRCITEDLSGNIWIGCNKGVAMYNRKDKKIISFNSDHGIPTSVGELTVNAITCLKDGRMVFSSMAGLFYCRPTDLKKTLQTPHLRFIACEKAPYENPEWHTLQSILRNGIQCTFPYDKNDLRLTFTVGDVALSELMEYEYKVQGLDNNWIPTEGKNTFILQNLAPGQYTVLTRGRIKGSAWSNGQEASLSITITPPWWLSWWAKTIYTLIVITILWTLLEAYKRRLKLESSLEVERRTHINEQVLNNERIRFYTNVTHELRTPLTLILGPIEELYTRHELPTEVRKKIGLVQSSAQHMLELVNKLLEFRKKGYHMHQLLVERANLGALIETIGNQFREANTNADVNIICNIDMTNLTSVWFDNEAVRTIVDNLMSNAIKYTPKGTITLSATTTNDEKEAKDAWVNIQVADTGYGIAPHALPYIFEPFYQARGEHQALGTGIGLALVQELVNLHHGIITAESKLNVGTTITVLLPLNDDYPDALHKGSSVKITNDIALTNTNNSSGNKDLGNKEETPNILLIVEDNDDIRSYIADSCRPFCQVIEAKNGKEGVETALEKIPDIIVSDVMMPQMDGFELCQKLKQDVRTCHIPIILLTAKDQTEDRQIGYQCGADSYITKPFSTNLLLTRIKNMIRTRNLIAQHIARTWNTDNEPETHSIGELSSDVSTLHSQTDRERQEEKITEPSHRPHESSISPMDKDFLERLTAFVEANLLNEDFNTDMAASHMCMSASTFYRKLKGLTGTGANQFIRKIKLKHAYHLLTTTQYNVTEVATRSGFNDLRYFRQCFKDEFGMNPSEVTSKD